MSFGLSAIHIASGLHDNGFGRLITTELSSTKARQAGVHLEQAGLRELVEIRQGDAFQTLAGVAGIDLLLLRRMETAVPADVEATGTPRSLRGAW